MCHCGVAKWVLPFRPDQREWRQVSQPEHSCRHHCGRLPCTAFIRWTEEREDGGGHDHDGSGMEGAVEDCQQDYQEGHWCKLTFSEKVNKLVDHLIRNYMWIMSKESHSSCKSFYKYKLEYLTINHYNRTWTEHRRWQTPTRITWRWKPRACPSTTNVPATSGYGSWSSLSVSCS